MDPTGAVGSALVLAAQVPVPLEVQAQQAAARLHQVTWATRALRQLLARTAILAVRVKVAGAVAEQEPLARARPSHAPARLEAPVVAAAAVE